MSGATILGPGTRPYSVPAKWAKHHARLLALHDYFLAERHERALAACEPLERFSMSMADAATDEFDHLLAVSELSAEQDALYDIEEALQRIEAGTYGICEISGKPISEQRLNALPWTRFSHDIERQLESQGQGRRMRLGALRALRGEKLLDEAEIPADAEMREPLPSDEVLTISAAPPKSRPRYHLAFAMSK